MDKQTAEQLGLTNPFYPMRKELSECSKPFWEHRDQQTMEEVSEIRISKVPARTAVFLVEFLRSLGVKAEIESENTNG